RMASGGAGRRGQPASIPPSSRPASGGPASGIPESGAPASGIPASRPASDGPGRPASWLGRSELPQAKSPAQQAVISSALRRRRFNPRSTGRLGRGEPLVLAVLHPPVDDQHADADQDR